MRIMKITPLAVALALVAAPAAGLAAGLYVPDSGTSARARGGAFCVAADDPLAFFYNPAGLADQHQKNQFLFDITVLKLSEKFQRTGIPTDGLGAGTTANNAPPPQIVPDILYSHSFSDKFTFGAGLHAPAGARYKFKGTGPQRFTNNELFLTEAGFGVSGSYRVHKMFAIGLTLETLITGVDQQFRLSSASALNNPAQPPASEDPSLDVPAKLNVMQTVNPTGILGMKFTPVASVEFGLSYRPQVTLDMPGTLKSSQTTSAPPTDDKIHFHTGLPSILRVGARYVQPTWDYELDFVMEDWSNHKEDKITADDGNFLGSDSAAVPRKWKAAYSVRGGSTFKLTETLRGMAGANYETSAVPKEFLDVGSIDAPKFSVNLGAKYDFGARFTVSGNLSHTFLTAQTVTNSSQREQSPFATTPPDALSVIGNGKYSGSYDMLGVSLLTKF